jgi:uncharacterized protein YciI
MKHFIVEATYLVPFEKIKEAIPRHRSFLQKGYDLGMFLCSGPKEPPVGGFLVARAKSVDDLKAMFDEEPFYIEKLASYTFREFQPVKRQSWSEEWFSEKSDLLQSGEPPTGPLIASLPPLFREPIPRRAGNPPPSR